MGYYGCSMASTESCYILSSSIVFGYKFGLKIVDIVAIFKLTQTRLANSSLKKEDIVFTHGLKNPGPNKENRMKRHIIGYTLYFRHRVKEIHMIQQLKIQHIISVKS